MIDQASPGSVIRLTGGSYDLSYNQLSGPFRIMIQGGWDDNFLERDPCQNATVIKSVDDFEVTNFGIGNTDQLTFVAEDLIFEKEISFNSIISLVASENATAYLSILNGTFINSGFGTGGAIDLLVKDTANCYVTIANTLIADHLGDGVSISVSDGGYANTKVYHSTIANNLKDDATSLLGNGLIGLSLDEGILELDIQNTLLFGNADQDLNLLNGNTSMLDVQLGSSIVGQRLFEGNIFVELEDILFGTNPLFMDPALGNYTLSANSPGFMAGKDLGLPGFGTTPNWGIKGCEESISSINSLSFGQVNVFPNPMIDYGIIEFDLEQTSDVAIQVFNLQGKQLYNRTWQYLSAGFHQLNLPVNTLTPGTYHLVLSNKQGRKTLPIVIVE